MDITLLIISLVIGAVIGVIVVNTMRAQLKSVRQQSGAGNYLRPGSLYLTQTQDTYLYQNTTRRPRPKQNQKK